MPFRRPIVAWSGLLGYAAIIFYFSSQPVGAELGWFQQSDKLLHIMEYALLGWLAHHAVLASRPCTPRRIIVLISIGIGILYGASDELHQYFVPTRNASIADVVADTVGVALGVWVVARQN